MMTEFDVINILKEIDDITDGNYEGLEKIRIISEIIFTKTNSTFGLLNLKFQRFFLNESFLYKKGDEQKPLLIDIPISDQLKIEKSLEGYRGGLDLQDPKHQPLRLVLNNFGIKSTKGFVFSYITKDISKVTILLLSDDNDLLSDTSVQNLKVIARALRQHINEYVLYELQGDEDSRTLELISNICEELDEKRILGLISETAYQMLEADIGLILQQKKDRIFQVSALSGGIKENYLGYEMKIDEDEFDYLQSFPPPFSLNLVEKDTEGYLQNIGNDTMELLSCKNCMISPLIIGGSLRGLLIVLRKNPHTYTSFDIQQMKRLSITTISMLGATLLVDKIRSQVVIHERKLLAREIHDSIIQMIGSILYLSDDIQLSLEEGKEKQIQDSLTKINNITRDVYKSLREEIIGLRYDADVDGSVKDFIEKYFYRFQRQWGIKINFQYHQDEKIKNKENYLITYSEVQIFRIFQEALTNARRHSGASEIWVDYYESPRKIRIVIRDKGKGFTRERSRKDNFGLSYIEERVTSVGGEFQINSIPDVGTELIIDLPKNVTFK